MCNLCYIIKTPARCLQMFCRFLFGPHYLAAVYPICTPKSILLWVGQTGIFFFKFYGYNIIILANGNKDNYYNMDISTMFEFIIVYCINVLLLKKTTFSRFVISV